MRVRGLKLLDVGLDKNKTKVAPHAGAWIETIRVSKALKLV